MAAYAPIVAENGETVAIIGLDMLVNDFHKKTRATLLPFLLFAVFLIAIIALLSITLSRVWNERVEALKSLDRQKDELLSMVSHQLATPITSVKWYLEMLVGGDLGTLNKEQIKQMHSAQKIMNDLAELVQMILDVSRIQLDRIKVNVQQFRFADLVNDILAVIEPKSREKDVNLVKKIGADIDNSRFLLCQSCGFGGASSPRDRSPN